MPPIRFVRHGDRHIAFLIDGHRQNFLALRFGQADQVRVWAPKRDSGERKRVHTGEVRAQVLAGIADAAGESGARLGVVDIQFHEGDTPSPDVYRDLARRIALRVTTGPAEFDGVER